MKYKVTNWQKGLTIVELAVIAAVMGLLIASTLGGFHLVNAAKLRKASAEFSNLALAVTEFKETYRSYPGDLPNAYDYWGGTSPCTTNSSGAVGSCNGDGDGYVEYNAGDPDGVPQEDLIAWMHLNLAELVPGSFTGQHIAASTRYALGSNHMASDAYTTAGYLIVTEFSQRFLTRGLYLRLAELNSSGYPWDGVMSAKDAYSIDVKLDDGEPSKGKLYAFRVPDSACVTASQTTSGPANYDLDDNTENCSLVYWIEKF